MEKGSGSSPCSVQSVSYWSESPLNYIWGTRLFITDRRIFWHWDLKKLFWEEEEGIRSFLKKRGIHYLLVKKEKIYDDRDFRHLKGYPLSSINRLPTFVYFELVLDNKTVSLWKLRMEGGPH
jgi:hypothetical protein